jgi:hypothetical protein
MKKVVLFIALTVVVMRTSAQNSVYYFPFEIIETVDSVNLRSYTWWQCKLIDSVEVGEYKIWVRKVVEYKNNFQDTSATLVCFYIEPPDDVRRFHKRFIFSWDVYIYDKENKKNYILLPFNEKSIRGLNCTVWIKIEEALKVAKEKFNKNIP